MQLNLRSCLVFATAKNDTEGKVSDKFRLLIFDLTVLPCEDVITCSQNWISFSILRWQSWWLWHAYLTRSPSVTVLPYGRKTILGQDPPWIWLPCDKSILPRKYIKTDLLSRIKSHKQEQKGFAL